MLNLKPINHCSVFMLFDKKTLEYVKIKNRSVFATKSVLTVCFLYELERQLKTDGTNIPFDFDWKHNIININYNNILFSTLKDFRDFVLSEYYIIVEKSLLR